MFSPANVMSVAAGVLVFVLGLLAWSTNRGVFAAAVTAGIVTGVVWLIWWSVAGPSDLHTQLIRAQIPS